MARETKIVTLNLAEELLERAVAEKGADYVYSEDEGGCFYANPTEERGQYVPGCIVGHVLNYLGLSPEELHKLDEPHKWHTNVNGDAHTDNTNINHIDDVLEDTFGIELTHPALMLLKTAQGNQDFGESWGDSVRTAKGYVSGLND